MAHEQVPNSVRSIRALSQSVSVIRAEQGNRQRDGPQKSARLADRRSFGDFLFRHRIFALREADRHKQTFRVCLFGDRDVNA